MRRIATAILVVTALACHGQPKRAGQTELAGKHAEVIIHGGTIVTLDPEQPRVEAMAIVDGRIAAVGQRADILALQGPSTQLIDLGGATAFPGFIDAHMHFGRLGKRARELYLDEAKSPADAIAVVAARAKETPKGQWIVGKGWHTVNWGDTYPDNAALSAATPDHPVYLAGMANHAAWVNARALEIAGVNAHTADPADGKIIRSANGNATGILIESAKELVSRHLPAEDRAQRLRDLRDSVKTALRLGLTEVHDAGSSLEDIEMYRQLAADGELGVRLHLMHYIEKDGKELDAFLEKAPEHGLARGFLNIEALKIYADGALGARGAALLAPYADAPDTSGMVANDAPALRTIVRKASKAGYQVGIHAIGDRGNRNAIDAIAAIRSELGDAVRRPRIEHAQVIAPTDIPRLAELGIIAAMQPIHCTMDMGFAGKRLGPERLRGAYAWRSLLDAGVRIVGGADTPAFPIAYSNPLWGIHAAITRTDRDGQPAGGFMPEQRVSAAEALAMYTSDAAFASFSEKDKGTLEVGKIADVTVLSKNILEIPAPEILDTEVVMTIVGGAIAYRRE